MEWRNDKMPFEMGNVTLTMLSYAEVKGFTCNTHKTCGLNDSFGSDGIISYKFLLKSTPVFRKNFPVTEQRNNSSKSNPSVPDTGSDHHAAYAMQRCLFMRRTRTMSSWKSKVKRSSSKIELQEILRSVLTWYVFLPDIILVAFAFTWLITS